MALSNQSDLPAFFSPRNVYWNKLWNFNQWEIWYTSKVAACGTGVAGSSLAWVVWFGDWEIGSSSKAAAGKTPLHVTTFFDFFSKSTFDNNAHRYKKTYPKVHRNRRSLRLVLLVYNFFFNFGQRTYQEGTYRMIHPPYFYSLDLFSAIIGRI